MTIMSGANVIIYSAQILVLVALAAIGSAALGARVPRLRLHYWQAVVAMCLLLPLISRGVPAPIVEGSNVLLRLTTTGTPSRGHAEVPVVEIFPWLLLAGTMVRIGWLLLGLVRLRELRMSGVPTAMGAAVLGEARVRPSVEIRSHEAIAQPVTFGVRHPQVLLPRSFFDLPVDAQRAVVCHELLHVERRDWLWILAEQLVQAVFWFHPAIWWALGRVRVSREQVVDAAVLDRTGARAPYLQALAGFAAVARSVSVAVPFVRQHDLVERIRALMHRESVSKRRTRMSMALVPILIAGSGLAAVTAFPLQDGSQKPPVYLPGNGVTLPQLIREVKPVYTPQAMAAKIEGTVLLQCVVDPDGTVSDIVVVESLDREYGLDDAAVNAAGQWRFRPGTKDGEPVPVRISIQLTFALRYS